MNRIPHRTRRRVILVNRMENSAPGPVAYAVHRSRAASRARSLATYRTLRRWAELRRRQLLADHPDLRDDASDDRGTDETFDLTDDASELDAATATDDGSAPDPQEPSGPAAEDQPDDSWTKGRLYELAKRLDIDGRSKMNKAELLDAVRDATATSPAETAETEHDQVATTTG